MEATLTKGCLEFSEGLLNRAFGFLHLSLGLQVRVSCDFANGFLGSALGLLRATLDALLVHISLSLAKEMGFGPKIGSRRSIDRGYGRGTYIGVQGCD